MPIRWRVLDREDYKVLFIQICLTLQWQIICFYFYRPFYALILTLPYSFVPMLFVLNKLKKKGVRRAVVLYRIISIIAVIALLISMYYVLYEWKGKIPEEAKWDNLHEESRTHLMAKSRTGMIEVLVSHTIVLTTDLSEFHV